MASNDQTHPDDLVPAEVRTSTSPVAIFSLAALKPGSSESDMRQTLKSMTAATREEQGCRQYSVHTSIQEPGIYAFYECWSTGADLLAHMKNPALQTYHAQMFGNLEMKTLEFLRPSED
ncbi:putative quinol monooxygenase [Micromonospora gifhornensis]|uniref:ABM domain-containing protein n=1 Tax=Micromonospora gifhornensis TaxID=84594 RepID=A0ABQ4IGT8_9ACTN|nr:putative quinol monooxygenase [Micromonospora gifhornensis]GIJ17126.1 hypothetical protein Vgi01_38100 [Micromonospora gifhornensis]